MTKIVFDIETTGVDFETLDEKSREYLVKYAEDEEEEEEIKNQRLGLYPFTGEVVAIGLFNPDTERGAVYFQAPGAAIAPYRKDNAEYSTGSEKEILEKFWADIKNYNQFVTFNGRRFDCPFLLIRSAMIGVKPTRNLMPHRYYDTHIDLLDQLTFYGAYKKFNLDFYAKSFGIKSPKEGGITGLDVKRLFEEKKYKEIAEYCFGDVKATAELYRIWEEYLRFDNKY